MASISLKNLTKSFNAGDDAPAAVSDLSLEIADNSFVTLLGPERLRQDHDAADDRGLYRAGYRHRSTSTAG